MILFNRLHHHVALLTGALLFCACQVANADDIVSTNKLDDAKARFNKGLILTEQGKTADAIQIFSALTKDYPELPEPYNNLAVLYANQGQYDLAKQSLEMAMRTHPSYATAHKNLGDIYGKMASQAYDRALQPDRSSSTTQTKLAMIQELSASGSRIKEASAHVTPSPVKTAVTTPVVVAADKATPAQTYSAAPSPEPAFKVDESKMAKEAVIAWAAAWSAKNTAAYLSFYAANFKTPKGETRAAWEAARKERISTPKFIHVEVQISAVQPIDINHVAVKFRQSYKADHMKVSSNKTLLMVKTGGKWLIQEERAR
jgi:tetratricopeptide (TPR) repeat protein